MQDESENKVILGRINKKFDGAKGLWDEQLHEVLWPYHTTLSFNHQRDSIYNGIQCCQHVAYLN